MLMIPQYTISDAAIKLITVDCNINFMFNLHGAWAFWIASYTEEASPSWFDFLQSARSLNNFNFLQIRFSSLFYADFKTCFFTSFFTVFITIWICLLEDQVLKLIHQLLILLCLNRRTHIIITSIACNLRCLVMRICLAHLGLILLYFYSWWATCTLQSIQCEFFLFEWYHLRRRRFSNMEMRN